jgi:peroxiredoxin 2/4
MKKRQMLLAGILLLSFNFLHAQRGHNQRIPLIGTEAPSFKALSTEGEISFPKDFGNDWKILFAHPRDFTPVCSSEILELAHDQETFKRLGAHLLVVSTDNIESHHSWKTALEEVNFKNKGTVKINFPLVEDSSYKISNSFGMLESGSDAGQSIRGVFFINPENKISAFYFYPNEVGRSTDEIKRTLVALQTNYDNKDVVLPANWKSGEDVMLRYVEEGTNLESTDSDIYKKSWFMIYKKDSGL